MTLKEFRSSYIYNTYSCVIINIHTYRYKRKFNSKSIIRIKNNVYWLFFLKASARLLSCLTTPFVYLKEA